jgi:hypothetical protein
MAKSTVGDYLAKRRNSRLWAKIYKAHAIDVYPRHWVWAFYQDIEAVLFGRWTLDDERKLRMAPCIIYPY